MKIARRIAIAACVFALSCTHMAHASSLKPTDISGHTPFATITVAKDPNVEPKWRKYIKDTPAYEAWATSPAMDNRRIPLVIIPAAHPGRPILYLLNGGDGGEGVANWIAQTDVIDFYTSKDINVVIPMSGKFSYYSDWENPEPSLGGKQQWETFLTKELPEPIEKMLNADHHRAIAGMSMSATSALLLAEHNPGFYDATAAFSGCYASSQPAPIAFIAITLQRGGTHPVAMWGPFGSPRWYWNDALIQAEGLRGTEIYVSNGSGLAGEWDMPNGPRLRNQHPFVQSVASYSSTIEGGIIEAATNTCTHDLKAKLDTIGIPADWNFRPVGTHSWGYWEQDLRASWATFERAFQR